MLNHSERQHALLSGSTAYRWVPCTGSVFLTKDLPEEKPSEHADKGTQAHQAAEIIIEDFLQHMLTGSDPDIRAHLLNYPEEIMELAETTKQILWEKVLNQHITGKIYGQEEKIVINEKLGMYGHTDFWCIEIDDKGKRAGIVADYKMGYLYVPAKNNAQLAFYAYGLRNMVREGGKDLDYVKAAIIQPKTLHEPFRETKFTSAQLDTWGKKFEAAAHQIYVKQKPKYKTGDWCTFCKAQSICKTYQKELSQKTSLKLIDGETHELPKPEKVPDEIIKNIVLRSDEITSFLKTCKAYIINRHRDGKPVPGVKVVEGKSKRTWIKDQNLIAEVLIQNSIDNPYSTPKIKGITIVEKELKKTIGSDKAQELMQQLVTKTNPPLVVVSEDDLRPAIKDLTSMLTLVDEDELE